MSAHVGADRFCWRSLQRFRRLGVGIARQSPAKWGVVRAEHDSKTCALVVGSTPGSRIGRQPFISGSPIVPKSELSGRVFFVEDGKAVAHCLLHPTAQRP
jgi:hypothetical protein